MPVPTLVSRMEREVTDDSMINEIFSDPSENQILCGEFVDFVWYRQVEFP